MKWLAGIFLMALALPAAGQLHIDGAWVRPTPPNAKLAAGYMTIHNHSSRPERLLGASSAAAERVEMHVHIRDGEILRMRQVKELRVPAGGKLEFNPGATHLMFVNIRFAFREGEKLPLTLRFERAGEVKVEVPVGHSGEPPVRHKH